MCEKRTLCPNCVLEGEVNAEGNAGGHVGGWFEGRWRISALIVPWSVRFHL